MQATLSIDDVVNTIFAPEKIYTRDDYAKHIQILNKHGEIVPFTPNRIQADYLQKRGRRNLDLKSRQVGMSSVIVWDNTLEAMTTTSHQAVLAHDSVTTDKLRTLARFYYDSLPKHMQPKRTRDNATTTKYGHTHSEVTIVTAGSMNIGRGGTYHRVHGSEVAFWKNADAIISGLLQGLTPNGLIDFESTANGAQGWFYEQCMKAMDGDADWTFHFHPWFHADEYALPLTDDERHEFKLADTAKAPALSELQLVNDYGLTLEQINWRRAKMRELPLTFMQEYPETPNQAFIMSGVSVFGDVTSAIKASMSPEYVDRHRYVAGVDWGQDNDYTAISIIESNTNTEVYINRWNHMPWEDMRAKIIDACIKWRVEVLQPEKNSASTNVESLRKEFAQKDYGITIRPMVTTNDRKSKWVGNFYKAIHEYGLQLQNPKNAQDIAYATQELQAFTQKQTKLGAYTYEASDGAHDDTVIARLLAWDAVNKLIG